jgi:hypothetical protein
MSKALIITVKLYQLPTTQAIVSCKSTGENKSFDSVQSSERVVMTKCCCVKRVSFVSASTSRAEKPEIGSGAAKI